MAEGSGEEKGSGNVPAVFISYASPDSAVAVSVCHALEHAGVSCWLAPRDVMPGDFYGDAIVHAIDAAKAVVVVLSKHSAGSPHVLREVERATSKRHPVLSLRTDHAPLPAGLEYFLNASQWLDSTALGMDAALTKLVQAAQRIVALAPVVAPAHSASTGPDARAASARPAGRSRWVLIAAAAVVVVGVLLTWRLTTGTRSSQPSQAVRVTADSDKTIAVLPFVDMSEKHDQEYFGDGMAEETLNLLAGISNLRVIGRTSSFQFKGTANDLRKVGQALGAAYIVEGSVRRMGDHVRVTAQLIDTRSGAHRWSQTYDRRDADALAVQAEIALGVAYALELEVANPSALAGDATVHNREAYDLYLRGLHAQSQNDQAGFDEAALDFRRALDLDPTLTSAAVHLALVYLELGQWAFMPPKIAFEEARKIAQGILAQHPDSPGAHSALASLATVYDWDWTTAKRESALARRLAPGYFWAVFEDAQTDLALGRWSDALRSAHAAAALDPLNPNVQIGLCIVYQRLWQLPQAEASCRRALAIMPSYTAAHYYLGTVLLTAGKPDAALAEMIQESPIGGGTEGLCVAYFALHRMKESDAALARLKAEAADVAAMNIAEAYAFRGQRSEALEWLERAYSQKDPTLYLIKGDPLLRNLEGDPRFTAFLRKMNLPE